MPTGSYIIVLSLAVLVMIGINMAEKDDTAQVVVNNNEMCIRDSATMIRRPMSLSKERN